MEIKIVVSIQHRSAGIAVADQMKLARLSVTLTPQRTGYEPGCYCCSGFIGESSGRKSAIDLGR